MATSITKTVTATMKFGSNGTVVELREFLKDIPGDAKIRIDVWKGDQHDPAQTTVTATWSV